MRWREFLLAISRFLWASGFTEGRALSTFGAVEDNQFSTFWRQNENKREVEENE